MSHLHVVLLASAALIASVAVLTAAGTGAVPGNAPASPGTASVYVGTYTGGQGKGIYRFELDLATGRASDPVLAAESPSPSFLAVHPTKRFLYAANELEGSQRGLVSAFAIGADGSLTPLNQQPSEGVSPCHLVVSGTGTHLLVANYSSGTAAVLPIEEDGALRPASSVVRHEGKGPDARRQEGPHAHSINLDPAGRFALVADLGLDKIASYRFDAREGSLTPNDPPAGLAAPGSGPRHLTFHPNGRYVYVINELVNTVTVFSYGAETGSMTEVQTVSTLPADFRGANTTGEVQLTPDGRFLYGSNRGHDSLAVFAVDAVTGKLSSVGHVPSGGKTPRHFGIDPTGRWLLASNQNSDSIVVFRIDGATGALSPTGQPLTVGTPVCVRIVQR